MNKSSVPEWLKHNFSRKEAENYLKGNGTPLKCFLVRGSQMLPWLILSIKFEDSSIEHYKIYTDGGLFYIFEYTKFASLEDLIKFYSENNWEDIIKIQRKTVTADAAHEKDIYKIPVPHKGRSRKPPLPPKSSKVRSILKGISAFKSDTTASEIKENYVAPIFLTKQLSNVSFADTNGIADEDEYYTSPVQRVRAKTDDIDITKFSRTETENYLVTKPMYSYLLRTSTTAGNICLSLKTETKTQHYVIYSDGAQYYVRSNEKFPSVKELIERYSKNNWHDLLNPREDAEEDVAEKDEETAEEQLPYDYADHYQAVDSCRENYMKTFTREQAEDYLSKMYNHSYLVRPSADGQSVLSIKTEQSIMHFKILKNDCDYYIHEYALFPTIPMLVKSYSANDFQDLLALKQSAPVEIYTKKDALAYLMTKPYYSHLVRDSLNHAGCKSLSIKIPRNILHYVIYSSRDGFYVYKDEKFDTIDELIETYSENSWERLFEMSRMAKEERRQSILSRWAKKLIVGRDVTYRYSVRAFERLLGKFYMSKRAVMNADDL